MKSCKHRNFWLISGATYAWCVDCGAIRRLFESGDTEVPPEWKRWIKPEGREKNDARILKSWKNIKI